MMAKVKDGAAGHVLPNDQDPQIISTLSKVGAGGSSVLRMRHRSSDGPWGNPCEYHTCSPHGMKQQLEEDAYTAVTVSLFPSTSDDL